jgi:uncharacterized Tic20 family protein
MEERTQMTTDYRQDKGDSEGQAHNWGMFCHLSALLGFIWLPLSGLVILPFGHLLGPLAIWLIKRKDHPFIDEQGKESLNFQISMTIYGMLSSMLIFVIIGIFLLIAIAVLDVVLVIIAAVRASEGKAYRYPMTIRFIK